MYSGRDTEFFCNCFRPFLLTKMRKFTVFTTGWAVRLNCLLSDHNRLHHFRPKYVLSDYIRSLAQNRSILGRVEGVSISAVA